MAVIAYALPVATIIVAVIAHIAPVTSHAHAFEPTLQAQKNGAAIYVTYYVYKFHERVTSSSWWIKNHIIV